MEGPSARAALRRSGAARRLRPAAARLADSRLRLVGPLRGGGGRRRQASRHTSDADERETSMTRKYLILLAVFLAAAAFGAGSAGAAIGDPASGFLDFNPATGQMSYASSDRSIWPDGRDDVTVAIAYTGYYAIQPDDWQFGIAHSANVSKYCAFYGDGWSCPASSLSIKTGKGNDTITIPFAVKIPTILEGGLGTDVIYGGGGPDVIWGGCSANPACDSATNSLHGGEGNDVIHGAAGGYDYVAGDAGDDVLDGGLRVPHKPYRGGGGATPAPSSRPTPRRASPHRPP